jgi:hypothetical protein
MGERGVLRRIADALASLERAMVACSHSFGLACLDGLVAYGLALHGLPPDWIQEDSPGECTEQPIMPEDRLADVGPPRPTRAFK